MMHVWHIPPQGFGRQSRRRLDQSGVPESEVAEGTVVFGRQPDEKPEPAPAAKKPAAKSDT